MENICTYKLFLCIFYSGEESELLKRRPKSPTIIEAISTASIISTKCNDQNAVISWEPPAENQSPIEHYIIQYNTSFTPDKWKTANAKVPSNESSFVVSLSPWANYTFRVIAIHQNEPSQPSKHGEVCTIQPDRPDKNPDNVVGKGSEPNNMVISWNVMPEIEHNAPHFQYRVFWKRAISEDQWTIKDISDWKQSSIIINDLPTFQKYRIKVAAINELGESRLAAKEVIGYSCEGQPTMAPTNFTVLRVESDTSATLSWSRVPAASVNGHFKGYKIVTWTDQDDLQREIIVTDNTYQVQSTKFIPNAEEIVYEVQFNKFIPASKNFARILVFNGRYDGPASDVIDFLMPRFVLTF